MATWHRLAAATAAASLVVIGSVPASAETVDTATAHAVLIPGATVFKQINPIYPWVATTYPDIGIHFHTDPAAEVVQYSQNALDSNRAIAEGVRATEAAVAATPGKVVVIGESMGAMVAWRVAADLANSPNPPDPDDISFVVIAPPDAGISEYFPVGTYIPILNYRIARIAESPYRTTIVIGEYDGWSDPPDRPWNLLADLNAVFGIAFVHGPPIFTTDPADVPPENITTSADGRVTTMLVPTRQLPLTQPLRLVGVPDEIVDEVDKVLRPMIDAGYVRNDAHGDTRPYLADGKIQRNPPAAPSATTAETPEEISAAGPAVPNDAVSSEADATEAVATDKSAPTSWRERQAAKRAERAQHQAEKREERRQRTAERRDELRKAMTHLRDEVRRWAGDTDEDADTNDRTTHDARTDTDTNGGTTHDTDTRTTE